MAPLHPAQILIVDDHPLVREGLALRVSLQPDMDVCGQAESEDDAIEWLRRARADLAIVDLRLRGGHGFELIKRMRADHADVKVLVLSALEESLYGERCLRAGAMGYLNKRESNDKLIEAIRAVLAGERYMSPALTQRLVRDALCARDAALSPLERLTDREMEILQLIGEGLSSRDIAERLFLSPHTIGTHRENLKRKIGLVGGAALTQYAVQWVMESN